MDTSSNLRTEHEFKTLTRITFTFDEVKSRTTKICRLFGEFEIEEKMALLIGLELNRRSILQ